MIRGRMIKNPETGRFFMPSKLALETGVYIDTDGNSHFSSEKEVTGWRRFVEVEGLFRAMLYFFDRDNLPKVE